MTVDSQATKEINLTLALLIMTVAMKCTIASKTTKEMNPILTLLIKTVAVVTVAMKFSLKLK